MNSCTTMSQFSMLATTPQGLLNNNNNNNNNNNDDDDTAQEFTPKR